MRGSVRCVIADTKAKPVVDRTQANKFLEDLPKESGVLISHLPGDLFYGMCREFQKFASLLHLQMVGTENLFTAISKGNRSYTHRVRATLP